MNAAVLGPSDAALRTSVLPRSWKAPIGYAVVAVLVLLGFGLGSPAGVSTRFVLATSSDLVQIPAIVTPSRLTAVVLAVIALALAGVAASDVRAERRTGAWLPVVFGIACVLAMLTWAGAGRTATSVQLTQLLSATVLLSVPLVFGALSGTVCERSGIVNIAIEGQLLFGAFAAAVVASATGSPYLGLVVAPLAGVLVAALLALFAVRYWVDQIVVGVVLNVLVVGITGFLFGTVLKENPSLNQAIGMPVLPIPLLAPIPVIGPVVFRQNLLVYLMYAVVVVLQIMLFRSRWGLRVRAVGEHPKAADTVGIKVNRTRVRTTLLGGAIAGLGGAAFTVAAGLAFGKEMTAGKGFIALAAMILGRWSPKGALAAALLFAFAEALRQAFGIMGTAIPSQFLAMLPYLATIFAVAGVVGRSRPPAAENIPYKK